MFKPTASRRRPFDSLFAKIRIIGVILLLVKAYYLHHLSTKSIIVSPWHQHSEHKAINDCSAVSGLDRVVISVRTGATQALLKVPTFLRTSLRCAPNVYVFSDMAQKLGTVQVYDALDTIPAAVKDSNYHFDLYRKQQEVKDPAKIVETLQNFRYPGNMGLKAAWVLDKYKFNHVVEKTWDRKPDMDWYFHVDDDTYVFLPSLASWLRTLNPSNELHIGNVVQLNRLPFAHGGSGILLSNAATRSFVVTHNGTAAKWDNEVRNNCCGDFVLSQILHEYGMSVISSGPILYGNPLWEIDFAPNLWCQPIATLHHITPSEAERIGKFEQQRQDRNAPVLYSDLFFGLVFETIPSEPRINWDNNSGDEIVANINSMEACIAACANKDECLQVRFNGQECVLGTKTFRLGQIHRPKEDERLWWSSWNRTRIAEWALQQKPCREVISPAPDELRRNGTNIRSPNII